MCESMKERCQGLGFAAQRPRSGRMGDGHGMDWCDGDMGDGMAGDWADGDMGDG